MNADLNFSQQSNIMLLCGQCQILKSTLFNVLRGKFQVTRIVSADTERCWRRIRFSCGSLSWFVWTLKLGDDCLGEVSCYRLINNSFEFCSSVSKEGTFPSKLSRSETTKFSDRLTDFIKFHSLRYSFLNMRALILNLDIIHFTNQQLNNDTSQQTRITSVYQSLVAQQMTVSRSSCSSSVSLCGPNKVDLDVDVVTD